MIPNPQRSASRPPPDRSPEGKRDRLDRLLSEFLEEPDEDGLTRVLEAWVTWRKSGQDKRGLCVEPGLSRLDTWGKRKIEERKRQEWAR